MIITNGKVYDILKWIALVLLPALGTLYVAIGAIWNFSNVQAVSGTILAVDTFLGGLIHLSASSYKASDAAYDGTFNVDNTGGTKTVSMELNKDSADFDNKNTLTFKVAQTTDQPGGAAVDPNGF